MLTIGPSGGVGLPVCKITWNTSSIFISCRINVSTLLVVSSPNRFPDTVPLSLHSCITLQSRVLHKWGFDRGWVRVWWPRFRSYRSWSSEPGVHPVISRRLRGYSRGTFPIQATVCTALCLITLPIQPASNAIHAVCFKRSASSSTTEEIQRRFLFGMVSVAIFPWPFTYRQIRSRLWVGESGAHSRMRAHSHFFLRFVGIRVVVRPQCKSAEYFFHHRPSFAVEYHNIHMYILIYR